MAPSVSQNVVAKSLPKRQRLSSNDKDNHYEEIATVQHAQIQADALTSPSVQSVFNRLLDTLMLSDSSNTLIQRALHAVKSSLDGIPKEPAKLAARSDLVSDLLRNVADGTEPSSLFYSSKAETLSVSCDRPSQINVVGSYLLGYCTAPVVDIAVEMPRSLFTPKDYRNYRYHDKRFLYLLYLANHFLNEIESKWTKVSVTAHHFACDLRKPVLSLSHSEMPGITVCIIPTYPVNMFDVSRLRPDRNNVRAQAQTATTSAQAEATPVYNQSVLVDSTPVVFLQMMHEIIGGAPNFKPALMLMHIWSLRHRLRLGKFVLAVLLCDLFNRAVVPRRAAKEHILRCAFSAISSGRLYNLVMCGVQVCAPFNSAQLTRCAECAARALSTIESDAAANDPWDGLIPRLFATARGNEIKAQPMSTLFDGFLKITHIDNGSPFTDLEILSVLQSGFVETGRIRRIEPLSERLYGLTCASYESLIRRVDVRNQSTDVDTFNSFWGKKANLRRFKDGKIIEALVWNGGIQTLQEIAKYVFDRHFKGRLRCDVVLGDLEKAAKLKDSDKTSSSRAILAFNELSSLLRSIDDLPLKIRDVSAISPHLRRCGMYKIRPNFSNIFVEALGVLITFESSKAWPKDAVALAASKAGFYVALKGKLAEKGVTSQVTVSYIDVTVSGFVFRVQLYVDIEKGLTEEKSQEDKLFWETHMVVKHHENVRNMGSVMVGQVCCLAKRWLNSHMLFGCLGERADILVELLVMAVFYNETLEAPRSPMSAFCRFLHLLAEFPWEVCPLLISMRSSDYNDMDMPSSRKHGKDESAEPNRSEQLEIAQKMHEKSGCALGIFVAHGNDVESWSGGRGTIENVLVNRIQATALAALQFIERFLTSSEGEGLSLKTVFTCSTSGFDAIAHLDERACVMSSKSKEGPMGVQDKRLGVARVAAGLDPIERVHKTIHERLGKWAVIFWQVRSGSELYVVWRPDVRKQFKFSLRDAAFCDPVFVGSNETPCLKPSIGQLVEEIKYLGQGLVTRVELLR